MLSNFFPSFFAMPVELPDIMKTKSQQQLHSIWEQNVVSHWAIISYRIWGISAIIYFSLRSTLISCVSKNHYINQKFSNLVWKSFDISKSIFVVGKRRHVWSLSMLCIQRFQFLQSALQWNFCLDTNWLFSLFNQNLFFCPLNVLLLESPF